MFKIEDKFLKECQLDREWPSGRAVFFNQDKSFQIKVNNEDHLEIQYSEKNNSIEDFFKKLNSIAKDLDKELTFSKNAKLGFITTLPENLGTTLKA